MRRLAGVQELLDGPLDDPAVLRGNLRDLARINRWLGGTAASRRALGRLIGGRTVPHTLLDVGTGGADIPLALVERFSADGHSLRVTAIDSRQEVLDAALAVDPRVGATEGLELLLTDGRSLPWPDRSFDVVHASLLVHHLEPPEALVFLREAARVARLGVIVNDLVRAQHHWLGARLLLGVGTRNRYTRHDGPLSVKRAYTRMELRALLAGAALRPVAEVGAFLGHRVAIAAVPMRELEQRRGAGGTGGSGGSGAAGGTTAGGGR
jgi:SAM-dependent methyltransferase